MRVIGLHQLERQRRGMWGGIKWERGRVDAKAGHPVPPEGRPSRGKETPGYACLKRSGSGEGRAGRAGNRFVRVETHILRDSEGFGR